MSKSDYWRQKRRLKCVKIEKRAQVENVADGDAELLTLTGKIERLSASLGKQSFVRSLRKKRHKTGDIFVMVNL